MSALLEGRAPARAPENAGLVRAVASFAKAAAPLVRAGERDELLHAAAREVAALVGVERSSIYLRDDATQLFRGCVGRCGDLRLDRNLRRLHAGGPADGVTQELVETRRPVIVTRAVDDPRTVKSTVRFWKIRSLMAVPMVLGDEVVGVIALDDVDRPHAFTQEDGEVAMAFGELIALAVADARERAELRAEAEAAQRQLTALRRAAAVDERIGDLVRQGHPLPVLLRTLAELLGKPCAVFDADGARVACSSPPGLRDHVVPRLLDPGVAGHPAVRAALAEHDGSRAFVIGPLPAGGVLHRHVVAPVVVDDDVWGRLVVMEHGRRFTSGDVVSVRRAATLLAIQVATERRAHEVDAQASSELFADVLAGGSDLAAVQRRAASLGVRLDVPRVVAVLAPRDPSAQDRPDARVTATAVESVAALVVPVGEAIVVLADLPDGADEAAFVAGRRAALEELLSGLAGAEHLVAGVSHVRAGAEGYRTAFEKACQVVECLRRFSPSGGPAIVGAGELGHALLFLATADARLVAQFAEDTFGRMIRDPSRADLLVTLRVFFEGMASVRRTAEAFRLHENTIRYRLSRVEELTGLPVMHDPQAQLRAQLALLVLRLQGRLPEIDPEDVGDGDGT